MSFVHLHVHSEYSLLDGDCRIKELPLRAKEMGQNAVAITDHGVMYGVIDFYRECNKVGVKPIIGCEVYVAPRTRFDKTFDYDKEYYHMVLLCKDNNGYKNLTKLVSYGYTEGFYNKPRIDDELLEKYHSGLICLSACLAGEIPRKIIRNEYDEAKEKALYYQKLFGKENFFLEIQRHGIEEEDIVSKALIRMSDEIDAPLVSTNDSHYIRKEDSKTHSVLLCIQTYHTVNDEDKMEFATDEFYLKSEEEMLSLFPNYPQAVENTQKIADMCNVTFEFGVRKLPDFDVPNGENHYEFFKRNCYEGLYKHYGANPDSSLVERLEYELKTIKSMGFVDYFLIVNDFVQFAKHNDIPVGPGRGSGAGSLCAYCIGITGIDPIKYDLIFERFLNPERVSMPDFDIDFCKDKRPLVIEYVKKKYGNDRVAQIIAFGTMAARGAIRDVGRALAIPYNVIDEVAKMVPMENGITLDKALSMSKKLQEKYQNDKVVQELIDTAKSIEGMPRHATMHAAGVVITKDPVSDYVPLSKNDDNIVTQFTMTTLEELGLLKMDFLGLRNLTVIDDAVKMIKRTNSDFNLDTIPTDDKPVYEMMSRGDSEGVFQFESTGMKNVLTKLGPENLEDLIAVISLYRPGPMDSIPTYIENRHNPNKVTYKHPLLKDILDVTYGCIVYQEQVMQIFRSLAGYSLGRADIVRRAMSKKKHTVMEKERNIFINGLDDENGNIEVMGCLRNGVDKATAESIYSEMESFASYAFNKSHAAAYATISYQTAYLKCHYPMEYMSALMTSVLDNQNKLSTYINECQHLDIKVLPPNVNYSYEGFTVVYANIRFGLLAIKNLGKNVIDEIISERENGKFTSFYDFCKRMNGSSMNTRALESLIKCGALDNLDCNRRQMLLSYSDLMNNLDFERKKNLGGQISLFDNDSVGKEDRELKIPVVEEFPINELLHMEYDIAGMYLSGHPLAQYDGYVKYQKYDNISNILDDTRYYHDGKKVNLLVIISKLKNLVTKSNQMMAFVNIEDKTGTTESLVFPKILSEYSTLFFVGNIIIISGRLSLKEDDESKIIIDTVKAVTDGMKNYIPTKANSSDKPVIQEKLQINKDNNQKIYLKLDNFENKKYKKVENILTLFNGNTPVILFNSEKKKKFLAPKSLFADLNDVLIKELKYILGDENVIIK